MQVTNDPGRAVCGDAALHDPDPEVRERAGGALGIAEALGSAGVPRLIGALADADRSVRVFAARVLGVMRAADAVPALRRVRDKDDDAGVRNTADLALHRITGDLDV